MDKVSVIIPAYNSSQWIAKTLRSVQEQTYSNLEIIVVNDSSTDNTEQIVKAIKDARICLYGQEHSGVSAARNKGIEQATGQWIAFLDADDLWHKEMIEQHLSALQDHPWAGVAYCWASFIDEEGHHLWDRPPVFYEGNVYQELIKNDFLLCGSFVAQRKAVEFAGRFDLRQTYGEDYDYWLRLAFHAPFVLVPRYQFFYRQWQGSTHATRYSCRSKRKRYKQGLFLIKEKGIQRSPEYVNTWTWVYYMRRVSFELTLYLEGGAGYQQVYKAIQIMCKAMRTQPYRLITLKAVRMMLKILFALVLPRPMAIPILHWSRDPKRQRIFSYLYSFCCYVGLGLRGSPKFKQMFTDSPTQKRRAP